VTVGRGRRGIVAFLARQERDVRLLNTSPIESAPALHVLIEAARQNRKPSSPRSNCGAFRPSAQRAAFTNAAAFPADPLKPTSRKTRKRRPRCSAIRWNAPHRVSKRLTPSNPPQHGVTILITVIRVPLVTHPPPPEDRLCAKIARDVLFDRFSRARYSTDSRVYRSAVRKSPCRDRNDSAAPWQIARRGGVPVLPARRLHLAMRP